ncbi:Muskelin-N domain-containing protein [Mycena kentingensis (nom. inval.)]|nr:Muskelin-N domain-containing protein [Mycena kentingensis (nom. inval.)]
MSTHALTYSIAASTPNSGRYPPENIIVDRPNEQSSRWSGGPSESGIVQWLLLRLDTLAVVQSITFGKYHNAHPCNMKDFKILVGASEDTLTEVLHGQLKNDPHPETFDLRHTNSEGIIIPSRFVKIIPCNTHGGGFHISIWHVALKGIKDEVFVEQVRLKYEQFRETNAMRYVLKHLRQRRFLTPYNAILSRCGLQVEDPLITELHQSVVVDGDWTKTEEIIARIAQTDLFDEYRNSNQCNAIWKQLKGTDMNGDRPSERGGHAMCLDPIEDTLYLFGGWNGEASLDDFWAYDIKADKWRVISYSLRDDGAPNAPSPRSCHKMVFDTKTGAIYVLGRLNDQDALTLSMAQNKDVTPEALAAVAPKTVSGCELYRYHTRGALVGQWEFLSPDPPAPSAPPLVYDHQMVMDSEGQTIYMYGGRVVDNDWANMKYAGLYGYNVATGHWQHLQSDPKSSTAFTGATIPARHGHAMVLDDRTRTLYIFGGKMRDTSHFDMYAYDIPSKSTKQLFSDLQRDYGHEGSFTVRGAIDSKLQEIYVFSGMSAEDSAISTTSSQPRVFRYGPLPGKWDSVPLAPSTDGIALEEPVPRFAHQVLYHPIARKVYMHGGNAGIKPKSDAATSGEQQPQTQTQEDAKDQRLDDFWEMSLPRLPASAVVRRATLQVRKQQFREMCEEGTHVKALRFLRNSVLPVVDQTDKKESELYRGLMSYLVGPPSPTMGTTTNRHLKTPSSSLDHEDVDLELPPKKRSRPNTPEDTEMENATATAKIPPFDVQSVRESEDPLENRPGVVPVTTGRFQQRNALFESLLGFVSADAKQPEGSLVNALDGLLISPP